MIDLKTEKLYPLSKAARLFPGGGKHVSQLHRYRMADENGIRLECVKAGGTLATSIEAMHRYIEAKTAAMGAESNVAPDRQTISRADRMAAAERKLVAAGV